MQAEGLGNGLPGVQPSASCEWVRSPDQSQGRDTAGRNAMTQASEPGIEPGSSL